MAENQPKIIHIRREEFPTLRSVVVDGIEHDLGVHKDFRRHPAFEGFIPENARLALAWVHLGPGEKLGIHDHPIETMIIMCSGRGSTLGDLRAEIHEGDVLLIERGAKHGFVGSSPNGYWALSIQFEARGLYENPGNALVAFKEDGQAESSLAELLRRNRQFMEEHKNNLLFDVIQSGKMADPARRGRLLDAIQVWSNHFQKVIMSRYVFSGEPRFFDLAVAHLKEEYGHNTNLENSRKGELRQVWDPVLEASASWFASKMLSLSDPEKTVLVHLVLEGGANVFHKVAHKTMQSYKETDHFEVHSIEDDGHLDMGKELLKGLDQRTYGRLFEIQKQGWDMLNLLSRRIAELSETPSSPLNSQ
jgi:quercetin dioxygenase-like cupin family protein